MITSVHSPAKINLHLKVFEKNVDGYHRVETTMVKIGLWDEIELKISAGDEISVTVDEPFAWLSSPDNLAFKATQLFLKAIDQKKSISIRIQKKIPLGAGLGGGSSNAGVVLRTLNQSFGSPLSEFDLMQLGKKLGADVPFFVQSKDFGFLKGRGDELVEASSFPHLPLLLVYPNINVSTEKVYQNLGRSLTWNGSNGIEGTGNRHVSNWKDIDFLLKMGNDLEEVTISMHPLIGEIRARLSEHGAYFAQMSGSGASIFGLFEDVAVAQKAMKHFEKDGQCFLIQSGSQS